MVLNKILNNGRFILSEIRRLKSWESFELITKTHENGLLSHEFKFLETDKDYLVEKTEKSNKFNTNCSSLSIYDCDLGNISFINFDFNIFDRVNYKNTKIQDGFLSGVQLPNSKINLEHINDFDQIRLFYGQIKSIYQNQGDTPRAIFAQAKELENYRKQLEINNNYKYYWYNFIHHKNLMDNFKDKLVLSLNKYSSNYGTNWLRASLFALCALFISFGLYCYLLGYRPGSNFDKFKELSSYSLQYLNPFRDEDSGDFFSLLRNDFGEKYKIPASARVFDYISRLIISFLVYQTITAFRRLGKNQ